MPSRTVRRVVTGPSVLLLCRLEPNSPAPGLDLLGGGGAPALLGVVVSRLVARLLAGVWPDVLSTAGPWVAVNVDEVGEA